MYNRIISFLFKFFFLSLFLGISYMIFIYTPANYEDKDLTKTSFSGLLSENSK